MKRDSLLLSKIKTLRQVAWEARADEKSVEEWLSNFETIEEQEQALYLLSRFVYFGSKQVRLLLKALYVDKFKLPLVAEIKNKLNSESSLSEVQTEYNKCLDNTKFFGVGNPSESGCHLLYLFRQENHLKKDQFSNTHEIFARDEKTGKQIINNKAIRRYIFIDDFCGSGEQALDSTQSLVNDIKELDKEAEVHYFVLLGHDHGLERIRKEARFSRVEAIYELDSSFKCFAEDSRHFRKAPNNITLDMARSVSEKYGAILFKNNPLGYDDSQLLLGFHHNTPNNSLPIIWSGGNKKKEWHPIFNRYAKF